MSMFLSPNPANHEGFIFLSLHPVDYIIPMVILGSVEGSLSSFVLASGGCF